MDYTEHQVSEIAQKAALKALKQLDTGGNPRSVEVELAVLNAHLEHLKRRVGAHTDTTDELEHQLSKIERSLVVTSSDITKKIDVSSADLRTEFTTAINSRMSINAVFTTIAVVAAVILNNWIG